MKPSIAMLAAVLVALTPAAMAQNQGLDLVSEMQERLRQLGYYGGPVNGDFGPYTQAALVQFQLSVPIPASGQLDDATLAALSLERPAPEAGAADSATGESAGPQETR
jgi:peptidoglycan hydrolase-like protein with peptidoglycan-binding domain